MKKPSTPSEIDGIEGFLTLFHLVRKHPACHNEHWSSETPNYGEATVLKTSRARLCPIVEQITGTDVQIGLRKWANRTPSTNCLHHASLIGRNRFTATPLTTKGGESDRVAKSLSPSRNQGPSKSSLTLFSCSIYR